MKMVYRFQAQGRSLDDQCGVCGRENAEVFDFDFVIGDDEDTPADNYRACGFCFIELLHQQFLPLIRDHVATLYIENFEADEVELDDPGGQQIGNFGLELRHVADSCGKCGRENVEAFVYWSQQFENQTPKAHIGCAICCHRHLTDHFLTLLLPAFNRLAVEQDDE